MTNIRKQIIEEVQKAYEGLDEHAENLDDITRCSIHLDNILNIIDMFSDNQGKANEEKLITQNWFESKNFVEFEDYGDSKGYFDIITENIYVVFKEYGQKGSTIIQEISKESEEYEENYNNYKEWKRKQCGWHKNIEGDWIYVSEKGNEYWIVSLRTWQTNKSYDCLGIFSTTRFLENAPLFLDEMITYICGENVTNESVMKDYIEKEIKKYEKRIYK